MKLQEACSVAALETTLERANGFDKVRACLVWPRFYIHIKAHGFNF